MISQNVSTILFSKYELAFHGGYKIGLNFHKMVLKMEGVIEVRIHYTTSNYIQHHHPTPTTNSHSGHSL